MKRDYFFFCRNEVGLMKYVVVTGAYGGMGEKTMQLLKAQGYEVFALDKKVKEKEEHIYPLEVDVTKEESVQNAFMEIQKITKEITAIIHFAGIYMLNSLVEMSSEDFKKIMDINLYGVYLMNKTFLPLLVKESKIVITTSELAVVKPLPFTGIYAISKTALDCYAYSLKMELQLLGIHVSVIRAGAIQTDMLGASTRALDQFCEQTKLYSCNAEKFHQIVDKVEAKCVSPEQIAKLVHKILKKKKPKFAYSINRNFLLKLFHILPMKMQFWAIRKVLKK